MAIISRLAVLLGLDTGEFNKNLGAAKDKVEGFSASTSISLAAVGSAFVGLSKAAIQFADEINNVAKANEVAVSSVLQLSQSLAINGGNADDAAKLFSSFNNKLDEAVQGSDKLRKSFKELGVTTKDLATLTEQQLIEKTLKGLSSIEDPVRRNALAFDILGRSVKGVDVKSLYDDYVKATGTFKSSEEVYKNVGLEIDKMDIRWLHFKDNLVQHVLPVLESIGKVLDYIHNLNVKLDPYFEKLDNFFGMGKKGAQGGSTYSPMNYSGAVAPNFAIGSGTNAVKRQLEMTAEEKHAAEMLKKQTEFYQKELMITEAKRQRLVEENGLEFIGQTERELALALFDIEKKRLLLIQEKKMTKEQANEWAQSEKNLAHFIYQNQQAQKTFEYGWKKAWAEYADNATNYAKLGEQAFVSVTQNMENALDTFVKTGKLNFKSLAASIIADLIAIQMKAQATQLFGQLGSMLGLTPGSSSSGMFTGSTGAVGGSILIGARASGGPITGGSPYLVGENGPELVIPNSSGTVIPNNSLASTMGSKPQVVYNGPYIQNMSAIDTQSATQFLTANKQTIWAANQSAQRSLPQGR